MNIVPLEALDTNHFQAALTTCAEYALEHTSLTFVLGMNTWGEVVMVTQSSDIPKGHRAVVAVPEELMHAYAQAPPPGWSLRVGDRRVFFYKGEGM